jgi:hypothetical protein
MEVVAASSGGGFEAAPPCPVNLATVASSVLQPDVTNLIGTWELCSQAEPTFIGCYSLRPTAPAPPRPPESGVIRL